MKKSLPILISISIFIVSIYISAFQPKDIQPIAEVLSQYHNGLDDCSESLIILEKKCREINSDSKSVEDARSSFIEARLKFKKIEFLAEYQDHSYIKNYINGAPLPSLEPKVPIPTKLEPNGFQILDELIFSDEILENKANIINLSSSLNTDFKRFENYQKNIPLYDRVVFEASRKEIIRVFTLGITGFDTPLSGNALPEAKTAIKSIKMAMLPYESFINRIEKGLGSDIIEDCEKTIQYLNSNTDFDSFDRLEFYKNYLKPLDSKIQKAHISSGIELKYEVSNHILSTRYSAKDFFSEDYFNPYFYTRISEEEDNEKVIELGKTLFFDPILSVNNERSCASCHNPKKAFTDAKRKSIARDFNGTVERNAPTLINSVYADRYFHDLRAFDLETVMEHVVTSREEFSLGLVQLIEKLKKSDEYQRRFDEAFANSNLKGISSQSITSALTSYLKELNSFNSDFDQYVKGDKTHLDESVKNGFNLFMGKAACGTCHFAPVFNGTVPPEYHESESEVLGVPEQNVELNAKIDADLGRYAGVLKEKVDFYKFSFKTPTVRNIALTAPYMHNGVFNTLEEVMDFYNKGGGIGLGYDVPHQTLPFDQLNLSVKEQTDIIAFMNALTDTTGLTEIPKSLPSFQNNEEWNNRKIGGLY